MDKLNKLLKLYIRSESKGIIDEEAKVLVGVVGSTGVIDRQGESLNPMGWLLESYQKNPVIMWAHDYRQLPVGKAEKVWIEDGKLMFNVKFADTPMAKDVFDLFKGGFLNAFSVGFIPKELDSTGEFTYAKQELLELSVVPVPANPEALLGNKEMSAKMKSIEDTLKEKGEEVKKEEVEQKSGRVLSSKNEGRVREAHKNLSDMLSELEEDKGLEETITLKKSELKAMIKEVVTEALKEVQVIKEVVTEKIVEVEKKGEEANDFLKRLRDGMRKQDKEIGLNLQSLNKLLSIKSSTKGGENK